MAKFQYRERSQEQIHRRATRSTGDFQNFISDEWKTYKPRKGENCIRILPAQWEGAEHYGLDVWAHWDVGPEHASVLCLRKMQNSKCPICEVVHDMERQGATRDELRDMVARLNVLVWLIDRKDERAGPQLWAMPPAKIDREIQKASQDRQTGQYYVVDHPTEGYDIFFDKEGEGKTSQYTGVNLGRQPTSVSQEFLDFVAEVPVPDTLVWRDYDEVLSLYEGGIDGGGRETSYTNGADPQRRPAPVTNLPSQRRPVDDRGADRAPARTAPQPQRQPPARSGWTPPQRREAPAPQRSAPQRRQLEPQADPNEPDPYDPSEGYDDDNQYYDNQGPSHAAPSDNRRQPPADNTSAESRAAQLRERFGRNR